MKKIALIGSTGSIGRQVLDVVRSHSSQYKIVALIANRLSAEFKCQIAEFAPKLWAAACEDKSKAVEIVAQCDADVVFNAAGGFSGLEYSLCAIDCGKALALANKETLVCGGKLVTELAKKRGVEIIPVDSEHSAIWQCLGYDRSAQFERLIITASGGAFRGYTPQMLEQVTPQQALNHPTWQMGKKITIDSATLMNKGYEVIEAHELYNAPYSKIQTVIQPDSVVHSLVEFCDGAVMAQLGTPSMLVPIQLALSYPERQSTGVKKLDFARAFSLEFLPINAADYPLFKLALDCGKSGGTMPCVLNAADEVAVEAFLDNKIKFTQIHSVVAESVSSFAREEIASYSQLEQIDSAARDKARYVVNKLIN